MTRDQEYHAATAKRPFASPYSARRKAFLTHEATPTSTGRSRDLGTQSLRLNDCKPARRDVIAYFSNTNNVGQDNSEARSRDRSDNSRSENNRSENSRSDSRPYLANIKDRYSNPVIGDSRDSLTGNGIQKSPIKVRKRPSALLLTGSSVSTGSALSSPVTPVNYDSLCREFRMLSGRANQASGHYSVLSRSTPSTPMSAQPQLPLTTPTATPTTTDIVNAAAAGVKEAKNTLVTHNVSHMIRRFNNSAPYSVATPITAHITDDGYGTSSLISDKHAPPDVDTIEKPKNGVIRTPVMSRRPTPISDRSAKLDLGGEKQNYKTSYSFDSTTTSGTITPIDMGQPRFRIISSDRAEVDICRRDGIMARSSPNADRSTDEMSSSRLSGDEWSRKVASLPQSWSMEVSYPPTPLKLREEDGPETPAVNGQRTSVETEDISNYFRDIFNFDYSADVGSLPSRRDGETSGAGDGDVGNAGVCSRRIIKPLSVVHKTDARGSDSDHDLQKPINEIELLVRNKLNLHSYDSASSECLSGSDTYYSDEEDDNEEDNDSIVASEFVHCELTTSFEWKGSDSDSMSTSAASVARRGMEELSDDIDLNRSRNNRSQDNSVESSIYRTLTEDTPTSNGYPTLSDDVTCRQSPPAPRHPTPSSPTQRPRRLTTQRTVYEWERVRSEKSLPTTALLSQDGNTTLTTGQNNASTTTTTARCRYSTMPCSSRDLPARPITSQHHRSSAYMTDSTTTTISSGQSPGVSVLSLTDQRHVVGSSRGGVATSPMGPARPPAPAVLDYNGASLDRRLSGLIEYSLSGGSESECAPLKQSLNAHSHTCHRAKTLNDPSLAVRDYVFSLGRNKGTTFGKTIENFIFCTRESNETNPNAIIRNIRQFMNGIKNYLMQTWEADFTSFIHYQRQQLKKNEFINLDYAIEGALHRCVVKPLKKHIYRMFVNKFQKNGSLQLISENIKYARKMDLEKFNISREMLLPDSASMETMKQYFKQMQFSYSPVHKLDYLMCVVDELSTMVCGSSSNICSSTDNERDITSLLAYSMVTCGVVSAEIELDYMSGLLQHRTAMGQHGHYLVMLHSVIARIKSLNDPSMIKSEMDWRLKIGIINEKTDRIDIVSIPAKLTMTARDICNLISHTHGIMDQQDYALYWVARGQEELLSDSSYPMMLRNEYKTNDYIIAFKRIDSKYIWSTQLTTT